MTLSDTDLAAKPVSAAELRAHKALQGPVDVECAYLPDSMFENDAVYDVMRELLGDYARKISGAL